MSVEKDEQKFEDDIDFLRNYGEVRSFIPNALYRKNYDLIFRPSPVSRKVTLSSGQQETIEEQ